MNNKAIITSCQSWQFQITRNSPLLAPCSPTRLTGRTSTLAEPNFSHFFLYSKVVVGDLFIDTPIHTSHLPHFLEIPGTKTKNGIAVAFS